MDIRQPYIAAAVADLGFDTFTEVQTKVIPAARHKQDVIGCSQTGTGKTHAYLIPIFEALDLTNDSLEAVITAPTRELAEQIYQFARHIASFSALPIDIRRYTGGTNRNRELERLATSQPKIAIGTPGKIHDLARKENRLAIHQARIFVIDEADMALDSGFLQDIDQIAAAMPEHLQMMVFSATIPEALRPFLRKYMNQPTEIIIKPRELSSLNIEHVFLPIKSKDRKNILVQLMHLLNPYVGIVFCNTKETVEDLYPELKQEGFNIIKLHGGMTPRERKRVMKEANSGTYQYILASDIASRGIDIDGVSHVINYDLPRDMEFYVHRTGRTGRADYTGLAISLYHADDDAYVAFLEHKGIDIHYKEIRGGELVERRERGERAKRENVGHAFNKHTSGVKKNDKDVKPGYKKKYHKKLQEARKKAIRKKRR